jgi:DNA-directed RNA polymerase specialized sigma24 family protein
MNVDDLPEELVTAFAQTVLTETPMDIYREEKRLRERLKPVGRYPEVLVKAQANEALAYALKHGFFFAESSEEFYIRFEPMIRGWLARWGAPYNHAFDLGQDLLWRCLSNRLRGYDRRKGKVTTFMKQAAFHLWIEKEIRARNANLPNPSHIAGTESAAMHEAIAQECKEQLYHAVPSLSPEQRAAIVSLIKGKSPDEIAEELGFVLVSPAGLLTPLDDSYTEVQCCRRINLTWSGHGFIDALKCDTLRKSANAPVRVKGGSTSFAIIKALALRAAAFLYGLG